MASYFLLDHGYQCFYRTVLALKGFVIRFYDFYSNPFSVISRWDDDVVFKNCAKDDDKNKVRFNMFC